MTIHVSNILSQANWTTSIEGQLKINAYGKLASFAGKHPYICKALFPLIGATAAITTVAKQIIQIAEDVFLGLAQILGALANQKNCSLKRGFSRLVVLTTLDTLKLPFSVIYAGFELIGLTFNVFSNHPSDDLKMLKGVEMKLLVKRSDASLASTSTQLAYAEHKKLYPSFFTA
jgi:hypothetical protein